MELIKRNDMKKRSVFYKDNKYVKVWDDIEPQWIVEHVRLLNKLIPNYVIDHGNNYIIFNDIKGLPANKFEHTDEFIRNIYKFCLENIEQTKPYVHGDWVLSNIIICPDNTYKLVDWDNVGIYNEIEYMNKLHSDLRSAFGDRFNDATGI